MVDVDSTSFFVIVLVATLAAITVVLMPQRLSPPVVVLELMFGIVVGPQVLGIADADPFIQFFSNLGLGMLFFFAGYEIDFVRIKGTPLRLGAWGWLFSILLAYAIGSLLELSGVVISFLYAGSAMATTAIGTLIPILKDNGELRTPFGTQLLAAGALGEFCPILLITLVLATGHPLHEALILIAFVVLSLAIALISMRLGKGWPAIEGTLEASNQLTVRIAVLLIFGLVAVASQLGLDILLGGFLAGMITRVALRGQEVEVFESKMTALGFGFLIPFFFVSSGLAFDLDALFSSFDELVKVPIFLTIFLIVRGAPALVLYRGVLGARDRLALAFYSATALPLVVAITTLAVSEGHMKTSNAAALVGAAILSTLIFPFVGLALRRKSNQKGSPPAGAPVPEPAV